MIKFTGSCISVSRILNAPVRKAWDLLTDTRKWRQWGPTVIDVECAERYIKKDVTGHVQILSRQWLRFIITEYEQYHHWNWRVASINATAHRVDKVDADRCRITFELPIWWAPYVFICLLALKRIKRMIESPTSRAM